jgi:hypothetical protein
MEDTVSYALAAHPVWARIAARFSRDEFTDPDAMDPDFLDWLLAVREEAGVPFRIISDARDPQGNVGAEMSAHKKRPCRAVDLQVESNHERFCIVRAAILGGGCRIGVYPAHADGGGGLHLDREPGLPQERIWTRY